MFIQEKALVGALSMIVKSLQTFVDSSIVIILQYSPRGVWALLPGAG